MSMFHEIYKTFRDLPSPTAGEELLKHYISDVWRGIERIHLEFKSKSSPKDIGLSDDDKKNLAKAISGFANSAGGLLIWGIRDDGSLSPICHINDFLRRILDLCVNVTDPIVPGIDGIAIVSAASGDTGYAILQIPESTTQPHRVILKLKDLNSHYYIRSGSSFTVASHVQLDDMFGRRPKPLLALNFHIDRQVLGSKVEPTILVRLTNRGRGIAKHPFVSLKVNPPYCVSYYGYDGNGKTGLTTINTEEVVTFPGVGIPIGYRTTEFGGNADQVIHCGQNLKLTLLRTDTEICRFSLPSLEIDYELAAEGCVLTKHRLTISRDELI